MSNLQSTDRAHAPLGKRGAFEGVARRHGRRRNPARTTPRSQLRTPTNPPRRPAQRWVEKCGRSIKGSETPHSTRQSNDDPRPARATAATSHRPRPPTRTPPATSPPHDLTPRRPLRACSGTGGNPRPLSPASRPARQIAGIHSAARTSVPDRTSAPETSNRISHVVENECLLQRVRDQRLQYRMRIGALLLQPALNQVGTTAGGQRDVSHSHDPVHPLAIQHSIAMPHRIPRQLHTRARPRRAAFTKSHTHMTAIPNPSLLAPTSAHRSFCRFSPTSSRHTPATKRHLSSSARALADTRATAPPAENARRPSTRWPYGTRSPTGTLISRASRAPRPGLRCDGSR